MSTSPDELVTLLSRWLAAHVDNVELLQRLDDVDADALAPGQAAAVEELRGELQRVGAGGRSELQMVVRETLEALALG
jgi:hypothetical protein